MKKHLKRVLLTLLVLSCFTFFSHITAYAGINVTQSFYGAGGRKHYTDIPSNLECLLGTLRTISLSPGSADKYSATIHDGYTAKLTGTGITIIPNLNRVSAKADCWTNHSCACAGGTGGNCSGTTCWFDLSSLIGTAEDFGSMNVNKDGNTAMVWLECSAAISNYCPGHDFSATKNRKLSYTCDASNESSKHIADAGNYYSSSHKIDGKNHSQTARITNDFDISKNAENFFHCKLCNSWFDATTIVHPSVSKEMTLKGTEIHCSDNVTVEYQTAANTDSFVKSENESYSVTGFCKWADGHRCLTCFLNKEPEAHSKQVPGYSRGGDAEYLATDVNPESFGLDGFGYYESVGAHKTQNGHNHGNPFTHRVRIYKRPSINLNNAIKLVRNEQPSSSTAAYNITPPAVSITNNMVFITKTNNPDGTITSTSTINPVTINGEWREEGDTWVCSFKDVRPGDDGQLHLSFNLAVKPENAFGQIGYKISPDWYWQRNGGGTVPAAHSFDLSSANINFSQSDSSYNLLTVYAHWCSDPGYVYAVPNSNKNLSNPSTDSAYAAYTDRGSDIYVHHENNDPDEFDSNAKKRVFDQNTTLPNVDVQNVTAVFKNGNGIKPVIDGGTKDNNDYSVDFSEYKTDVRFNGWSPEKLNNFGYNAAASCLAAGCDGHFHGTYDSSSMQYTFNHGNWNPTNQGQSEVPGSPRTSNLVASFDGSWKIQLPNAYKTGYIFTGWYSGDKYVGTAGDIYDLKSNVVSYNYSNPGTCPDFPVAEGESTSGGKKLKTLKLTPHFEPLKFKVLYEMNIPYSNDPNTKYDTSTELQSHTVVSDPKNVTNMHSYTIGGMNDTSLRTFGSTLADKKNYSYIGEKTYTYNGTDWNLEPLRITVNDFDFIGWRYKDIVWSGRGGIQPNGIYFGYGGHGTAMIIGGDRESTHDMDKDYSLKTLSMAKNCVQNVKNNRPDTPSTGGAYTKENNFAVKKLGNDEIKGKNHGSNTLTNYDTQTDGTCHYGTGKNNTYHQNEYVYLVLEAQWTDQTFHNDVEYNSNNQPNETKTQKNVFTSYKEYIKLLNSHDSLFGTNQPITSAFGGKVDAWRINSADTYVGDTSDDGSYDKNATSDVFVTNKSSTADKYFSGISNGRRGFFSFQGWSAWKYATWRDAIDSNKKDKPGWTELQPPGNDTNNGRTTYRANALTLPKYNDVKRSKRVGDLYYRMTAVLYPYQNYTGNESSYNNTGNMLTNSGGDMYSPSRSKDTIWNAYLWRWTQGNGGHYARPMKLVKKRNIQMYAVWDAYPTTKITNVYCDKDDIRKLTPGYLFSKVVVSDYEDFWNRENHEIGGNGRGVDWNTVCTASSNMNGTDAAYVPAGDYTYTYKIKNSNAYEGGTFTATLVGYDFGKFQNVQIIDDVGAVSLTFKFTDSAGNTTFKTAWVYINDEGDEGYNEDMNANGETDNTRYSLTRFISEENYNKADFAADGEYAYGSAKENEGALLSRSKWYMNTSYRNEIQNAFKNLKAVGGSSLSLDLSPINTSVEDPADSSHVQDSLFNISLPKMRASWSGEYHPQLVNDNSKLGDGSRWQYPWTKIEEKTVGIYVLDFDDIMETKKFVKDNGLDTGNFRAGKTTVKDYLTKFRQYSLVKNPDGTPTQLKDLRNYNPER